MWRALILRQRVAEARDVHTGESQHALDALGRVLGEDRGDWDGTGIGTTREDRNWSLTAMGNWASRDYDLDGLGTDFAEDNTPIGTHFNNANEWIQRNITTGGSPVTPLYDDNGNMTDDDKDYVYEYDAWNRLTSISTTGGSPTLVAEYRYNGLGQRIAEGDGTDTEYLIYDDRWRLISRHDGTSDYLEETFYHQTGLDGYGGASDVDSVLMRRTFLSTGTPQTRFPQDGSERWYVLQNWRQDVVAIISEAAVQRERVFYSSSSGALRSGGRVYGMVAGDTGVSGSAFDGSYGPADDTAITGWSGYDAYVDVDLDGDVDTADAGFSTNETMGWGVLSRDGATVGYAGYVQDDYVPTLSHVRHRVYKSDLGRWVQRDPAGYVDGANLYEYVMGSPAELRDPMGLASLGAERGGCSTDFGCGGSQIGQVVAPPRCHISSSDIHSCLRCCRTTGQGQWCEEQCNLRFYTSRFCRQRCEQLPFGPLRSACMRGCSWKESPFWPGDTCYNYCDVEWDPLVVPYLNQACKEGCDQQVKPGVTPPPFFTPPNALPGMWHCYEQYGKDIESCEIDYELCKLRFLRRNPGLGGVVTGSSCALEKRRCEAKAAADLHLCILGTLPTI